MQDMRLLPGDAAESGAAKPATKDSWNAPCGSVATLRFQHAENKQRGVHSPTQETDEYCILFKDMTVHHNLRPKVMHHLPRHALHVFAHLHLCHMQDLPDALPKTAPAMVRGLQRLCFRWSQGADLHC